ncbi:hypothetical protein KDH_49380 [Dictyobacter sp. S3.2.2.5]|uniref:Uncharacterized protein n=1 Tax=Dictyobacter halimunensis TaxID=3026934 RepID=A0ABQ6FV08_9CHLR|nr:hypothetical protein KDH_49380 [Dictyobacter sp. S3.2.2.5]
MRGEEIGRKGRTYGGVDIRGGEIGRKGRTYYSVNLQLMEERGCKGRLAP